MISWLIASCAIVCFSMLGLFYKLGNRFNADSLGIAFFLFLTAALGLGVLHLGSPYLHDDYQASSFYVVYGLGIGCGICQAIAVVLMLHTLRNVNLGLSFTILNLAVVIPLLVGVAYHLDPLNAWQIVGIVCIPLIILLFSWEQSKAKVKTNIKNDQPKTKTRSVLFLLLIFLANGFSMVLVTEMSYQQLLSYQLSHLFAMYSVGGICIGVIQLLRSRKWNRHVIWTGIGAGLSSLLGMYFSFELFRYLLPSVAMPLITVGQLGLIAVLGWLIFKERLGIHAMIAIGMAMIAIFLINQG